MRRQQERRELRQRGRASLPSTSLPPEEGINKVFRHAEARRCHFLDTVCTQDEGRR